MMIALSSPRVFAAWTRVSICAYTLFTGLLAFSQRKNWMAWQPMSMATPPPERSTSQKCSACGPSCFSDCLKRTGWPSTPSSRSCFSRTYLGVKQSSSAYISLTPAFAQAAIMRSASARLRHSGFSTTTCLPAAAALTVISQCAKFGAPTTTMSISSIASIASRSLKWCAMPYFDANSRACPAVGDITASSSACGTMRRASAWIVLMNREPTSPTRTLSPAMSVELRAAGQLSLDAAHAPDARSSAAHAEFHAVAERSAFQPRVQEPCVEIVSGSRRIRDAPLIERGAGELDPIAGLLEGDGAARSALDHRQLDVPAQPFPGVLDIARAGNTHGFLFVGHEDVHVAEDFPHGAPVPLGRPVRIQRHGRALLPEPGQDLGPARSQGFEQEITRDVKMR